MPFQKLELLAPAGKMEVLHSVVEAGADAVYLGGKRFNMRALKTEFNFTDEEIKYAVDFLHKHKRKIYITLNNLYNDNEIDDISNYLLFLQEQGVDALIVQDLGIVELCQKLNIEIPLHASVQMGIANLEAVNLLEEKGFQRVILSKNVSLSEINAISTASSLGIEYFVHGDLCISHTGQCYMSSFVGGESGNRGRCRKPCRWQYKLQGSKDENYSGYQYFLAHNDLCLYPYLRQLIDAGISSFKIEGRMRSAEYLAYLVSTYRRALNTLIEDPASYITNQDELLDLEEHRVRDYTVGNLFKPLDRKGIGFDGKREPNFITTAEPLIPLTPHESLEETTSNYPSIPELTIKVGSLDSLESTYGLGINNIILGCDKIRQIKQSWTYPSIQKAFDMLRDTKTKIYLEMPRIVSQKDLESVFQIKEMAESIGVYGVVVNDLGSLNIFRDSRLEVWGGYGLNTFNHSAAYLLEGLGVSRITASLEMDATDLKLLLSSNTPTELMVHGPLPGMVSDYCMVRAAQSGQEEECELYCLRDEYSLLDCCNQKYKITTDHNCRTYLFFPYELCLLPYLPHIVSWGVKSFRIDGQYYNPEKLGQVAGCYADALDQMKQGYWHPQENFSKLMNLFPEGLTAALLAAVSNNPI